MYNESLVAYQEVLELTPNNADAYRGWVLHIGKWMKTVARLLGNEA